MHTHANQSQENSGRSVAADVATKTGNRFPAFNNGRRSEISQLKNTYSPAKKDSPDPSNGNGVAQRVIATVGYDVNKEKDSDPLVADEHATVGRGLKLLKEWHGNEPDLDIVGLQQIIKGQPLNILGHGSADRIQSFDAAKLAGIILRLKNLDELKQINLYSCSTNSKADGFTAQLKTILLAAKVDIPIFAPPGLLGIGKAENEEGGTRTYPPKLREELDTAREVMLEKLAKFKLEEDQRIQKLREDAIFWKDFIDKRIIEVLSDKSLTVEKQKTSVNIQSQNLIDKKTEIQLKINQIDRDRKKVDKEAKEKYLKDRTEAVKKIKALEGPALTEVKIVEDEVLFKDLQQVAESILGMIKFENTPIDWGDDDFGPFVSATKVDDDDEFGPFVGATNNE